MTVELQGDLQSRDAKIAIVVSRFNDFVTTHLLDAAVDTYRRHGGNDAQLTVAWTPGSFEIPTVALRLAQSGKFDAVVCLGCIIRGGTSHFDFVANEAAKGIGQVSLQTGVPCIFGVITADNLEQAIDRAGAKQGNSGAKAMAAAIEMVNLLKQVK
ncbi:MAG: 6,7-dimethyl-8-ribityllumazine synthase [Phycisphaeraceae bacterium]|nr:6,7-dimethyl-8-ribityllumazine synthase [Phycisphaeraceae bacterium]